MDPANGHVKQCGIHLKFKAEFYTRQWVMIQLFLADLLVAGAENGSHGELSSQKNSRCKVPRKLAF